MKIFQSFTNGIKASFKNAASEIYKGYEGYEVRVSLYFAK